MEAEPQCGVEAIDHMQIVGPTLRPILPRCLLYTSDAADERSSVDLGGRRIIKKKKKKNDEVWRVSSKLSTRCKQTSRREQGEEETSR